MSRSEEFASGQWEHLGLEDTSTIEDNPMKYDDSVFDVVEASDRYKGGAHKVTEESIPASRLHATQDWIDSDVVASYAEHPDDSPIDVVRLNRRNFVMDGHHRATAALQRNRPVRARVYHWRRPSF